MGGQQQQPEAADMYRGWGNMNMRSGDRVLGALGQSQIGQAAQMDRGDGALLLKAMSGRRGGLAKTPEELDAITARAAYERAKTAGLGKTPTGDPLRTKNLELKNKKLERELTQGESGINPKLFLEGYDLSPEAQPSPPEMTSIRKAQANANTMTGTIAELQQLYKQFGNSPLPGPVKAKMSALATDLMLAAKGPEMYQLGVIAGPDMEILGKIVTDPTSANATALDFIGDDQSMARLTALAGQVKRRFGNSARSLGFKQKSVPSAKGGKLDLTEGGGGVVRPATEAEYNALPSGTVYIGPEGKQHRKQ
jgi:hypothetical protein